jgi:hypothetical protein
MQAALEPTFGRDYTDGRPQHLRLARRRKRLCVMNNYGWTVASAFLSQR